jgi:hypothetical protein
MDEPRPELDVSEIATAMWRQWETAELRPPDHGLERVEVRDGDLCIEYRATAGTLHHVTVRADDLLAVDARDLGAEPVGDPNETVAAWLDIMIEEEIDSGGPSPPTFTFDPN